MWQKIVALAIAGAIGTLARYFLASAVQRVSGDVGFPWGTLAVNTAGCFLFGLIWATVEDRHWLRPDHRVIVLTGFMGAFTTFSTFAFETGQLMRNDQWMLAGGNIVAQITIGIAALFAGFAVARTW